MSVRFGSAQAIHPPAMLGVLGGGQLGRMFIQAAQRMGYRTIALVPTPDSPAAQVAERAIVGRSDDLDALRGFAAEADAITVEFENISAASLRWLGRSKAVRPGWKSIRTAQNRLREKGFLARHGFPVGAWRPVRNAGELDAAVSDLGTPLILKTAASGYDGKGQIRIHHVDEAESAWAALGHQPAVAESVVAFALECSVIVARGHDGASGTYPPFWNQHANHVLDLTLCPAPLGPVLTREARELAQAIAESLDHVGMLAVEFFVTRDGSLLVNELAPRPHNSGHLTLEAAQTSQFEQQVRTLCGLPLGAMDLVRPAAMANLLGDLWSHGPPAWVQALRCDPGVHMHLYGKPSARPGRKMGHLTVLDDDPETALRRVSAARSLLAPPRA